MTSAMVHLRGLYQLTVWSHYNRANIPPRYQMLYTTTLPLIYFILGLYGAVTINLPISSIDDTLGPIYGDLWSTSLMITGFGSLLGIIFYDRLLWLEIWSMSGTVALMLWYIFCLFWAAVVHLESFRYLSLLLVIVTMPLPAWRIIDIVRELRPPAHVE